MPGRGRIPRPGERRACVPLRALGPKSEIRSEAAQRRKKAGRSDGSEAAHALDPGPAQTGQQAGQGRRFDEQGPQRRTAIPVTDIEDDEDGKGKVRPGQVAGRDRRHADRQARTKVRKDRQGPKSSVVAARPISKSTTTRPSTGRKRFATNCTGIRQAAQGQGAVCSCRSRCDRSAKRWA